MSERIYNLEGVGVNSYANGSQRQYKICGNFVVCPATAFHLSAVLGSRGLPTCKPLSGGGGAKPP